MSREPVIDAVVTWVDGDDPALLTRREAHLVPAGVHREASRPTRFRSVGEIEYCLASILKFAPFIRRIFVVTDNQVPAVVSEGQRRGAPWAERIQIIDHREIFAGYEQYLPTFSNRPIETMLHRTPGIAEHFITFNDDFFLLRAVQPADFFVNGAPVLRGEWRRRRWERDLGRALKLRWPALPLSPELSRPTFRLAQSNAAALAGFTLRYFHSDHVPRPLRKSTLDHLFAERPEWLHANLAHRLRDASQFFAVSLANHHEIRRKTAVVTPHTRLLYLKPAEVPRARVAMALRDAVGDESVLFACLQSLDEASRSVRNDAFQWLDGIVGRLPL